MRDKSIVQIAAALVALIAWAGLAIQFHASWGFTSGVRPAPWARPLYFAIGTNLLVAVVFTLTAVGSRVLPSAVAGTVRSAVLVGIARSRRPARYDPRLPLAVTHVPKSAGTAVSGAMIQALAPSRTASGFDACLFGGFRDFDRLAPDRRATIHLTGDPWPRDASFIVAHMAVSTTRRLWPTAQSLAVLRDPVSRLLSLFMYWRATPAAEVMCWGGWGARVALAQGPLAAFLDDPRIACQTDNCTTRMLLWPHAALPDDAFITPADDARLLRAARQVLACFSYVDIIEQPDFYQRLGAWLGCQLTPRAENIAAGWTPIDLTAELTSAVAARLLHLTRLDRALWRQVAGPGGEHLALAAQLHAMARYGRAP